MEREEAMNLIRQYKANWIDEVQEAIETIIPELRESEDEMTCKRAIAILKQQRYYWSYDGPKDKCPPATLRKDLVKALDVAISYLEKQKEQKQVENPKKGCPTYPLSVLGDLLAKTPQGPITFVPEQKPVEWKPQPESLEALMYAIEGKWEMIKPTSYLSRKLEDLYEGLVNAYNVDESYLTKLHETALTGNIDALTELKNKIEASMDSAAPKDQDYSGLNDFERAIHCGFLCAGVENVPVNIIKETAQDCLAHLQVEWSEEDEDMLNSCISSIEEAKENRYAYKETDGDTSYDHEIAWLKLLRNRVGKEFLQPHWKPSEEQIKVLKWCRPLFCEPNLKKVLESLIDDLEKLM